MSLIDRTNGDAEETLRDLSQSAYANAAGAPGLAAHVLRRARRRRRRLAILGTSVVSAAALSSVAAINAGGGPYYEYRQPSAVMEPAVPTGSSVVVNRDLDPQRMDVVQLEVRVDNADINVLMRVVGTAGDAVACPATSGGDCSVTVNGAAVGDEYVAGLATRPFSEMTVPEGELFLLGDARGVAIDSRVLGPIDSDDVNGVVVAVVSDRGRALGSRCTQPYVA